MPISKINNAALGTIDQINTGVTGYSLGAGNASIMKNRIINGAMVIDQRNAGASVTITNTADITYTVDRWYGYGSQASKISVQQNAGSVTPPAGFTKYLGVTSLSAYSVLTTDNFAVGQRIEGYNIADLSWGTANAKAITLSFWVYSSLTGTLGGAISNGAYSYPFTYSIPVANTWTQISVAIPGPTVGSWGSTNTLGFVVQFGLGVGATYNGTAGSWTAGNYVSATGAVSVVGTSGATFYITGVQLEVGSSATGFEYRQYQQELALCQRYCNYMRLGDGTAGTTVGIGAATSATQSAFSTLFPVVMRATPTVSYSGLIVTDNVSYNLATTSLGSIYNNPASARFFMNHATGATQYRPETIGLNLTTDYLAFIAEL